MTVAQLHADALKLADARQPEVVARVLNWLLGGAAPAANAKSAYVELVAETERRAMKIKSLRASLEVEDDEEWQTDYVAVRNQIVEAERERDKLVAQSVVLMNQMKRDGVSEGEIDLLFNAGVKSAHKTKGGAVYLNNSHNTNYFPTTCTTATTYHLNYGTLRYGA